MKTPFIPTAMRCTQEQFEAIKPKMIERGCELEQITDFEEMPYLEAFKVKFTKNVVVTNVKETQDVKTKIYEEWNEEIFLRNLSCEDIEEKAQAAPRFHEGGNMKAFLDKENEALKSTNEKKLKEQIKKLKDKNRKHQIIISLYEGEVKLLNSKINELTSKVNILKYTPQKQADYIKRLERGLLTQQEKDKLLSKIRVR